MSGLLLLWKDYHQIIFFFFLDRSWLTLFHLSLSQESSGPFFFFFSFVAKKREGGYSALWGGPLERVKWGKRARDWQCGQCTSSVTVLEARKLSMMLSYKETLYGSLCATRKGVAVAVFGVKN